MIWILINCLTLVTIEPVECPAQKNYIILNECWSMLILWIKMSKLMTITFANWETNKWQYYSKCDSYAVVWYFVWITLLSYFKKKKLHFHCRCRHSFLSLIVLLATQGYILIKMLFATSWCNEFYIKKICYDMSKANMEKVDSFSIKFQNEIKYSGRIILTMRENSWNEIQKRGRYWPICLKFTIKFNCAFISIE